MLFCPEFLWMVLPLFFHTKSSSYGKSLVSMIIVIGCISLLRLLGLLIDWWIFGDLCKGLGGRRSFSELSLPLFNELFALVLFRRSPSCVTSSSALLFFPIDRSFTKFFSIILLSSLWLVIGLILSMSIMSSATLVYDKEFNC